MNSDDVSRQGVAYCELVFSQQGIMFREQPTHDYGIDAQIETRNHQSGYASGKLVAVQIKSGSKYFSEESNGKVIYRGEMKHYDYWLRHSLPVIIVLYNPDTKECIWEHVNSNTARKTPKRWKIGVPKSHRLTDCKAQIEEIAENQTEYEKKLHTLLLAKPWMQAIVCGDKVILESEEWVNKCSGRGSLTLKILHDDTERVVINWPYVFWGLMSYADVFRTLFPWAVFTPDPEIYDMYEKDEFISKNGIYDAETGCYLFSDHIETREAYQAYLSNLPDIRPYTVAAGEVAKYRLVLSLNNVGVAFLELNDFLEHETVCYIDEDKLADS